MTTRSSRSHPERSSTKTKTGKEGLRRAAREGEQRCEHTTYEGTRCKYRANQGIQADGRWACGHHSDKAKATMYCKKCGRIKLKGYDTCYYCAWGRKRNLRRYPVANGYNKNLTLRKMMDQGLIAQKVAKYKKLTDPIEVATDTLRKSVAVLDLAIEDFEAIRKGKVTHNNGKPIDGTTRADIEFISDQVEKASRAAERTLNMMAKQALTAKELQSAKDQVLRVIKEVVNTYVPPAQRKDAIGLATKRLSK